MKGTGLVCRLDQAHRPTPCTRVSTQGWFSTGSSCNTHPGTSPGLACGAICGGMWGTYCTKCRYQSNSVCWVQSVGPIQTALEPVCRVLHAVQLWIGTLYCIQVPGSVHPRLATVWGSHRMQIWHGVHTASASNWPCALTAARLNGLWAWSGLGATMYSQCNTGITCHEQDQGQCTLHTTHVLSPRPMGQILEFHGMYTSLTLLI